MGKTNFKEYLVAGGVAGVVSRTAIAPIERVKILFQIGKASAGSSSGAGWTTLPAQILRDEGVAAFWKGNTAAVVRVLPYMSLTFLSYEEYKAGMQSLGTGKTVSALTAGSLAGLTAVALTYPLDMVRASMATPSSTHTSMAGAMQSIVQTRGVGALYSGISATMVGVAPYAGLKFSAYEGLKGVLGSVAGVQESELKPWQRVWAGAVAGLIAQTAVYPLDVVRRRMQTHDGKGKLYDSPVHALRTIAREEGVVRAASAASSRPPRSASACAPDRPTCARPQMRGLYRGLTLNWLKTAPNVAIYMSLYDTVKAYLVA